MIVFLIFFLVFFVLPFHPFNLSTFQPFSYFKREKRVEEIVYYIYNKNFFLYVFSISNNWKVERLKGSWPEIGIVFMISLERLYVLENRLYDRKYFEKISQNTWLSVFNFVSLQCNQLTVDTSPATRNYQPKTWHATSLQQTQTHF